MLEACSVLHTVFTGTAITCLQRHRLEQGGVGAHSAAAEPVPTGTAFKAWAGHPQL